MADNILTIFNEEHVTEEEGKHYRLRRAVRIVVFDSNNKIALLYIEYKGQEGSYILPGGGVHKDETFDQAAIRECSEELGCEIEITQILGTIMEYWKEELLKIENIGYIGKIVGEKNPIVLVGDEDEAEKKGTIVWVTPEEALTLVESNKIPEKLYVKYVLRKSLNFLQKVIEINNFYCRE
ncbi:NUDIX domain-containing protein [Patescibacteria group bacterium]|nr:NUDIX domain-containing protein [Patescibacteria group bacterium]